MQNLFYPRISSSFAVSAASFILRVVMGFAMIAGHGWRKFLKAMSEDPIKFSDPIGIGEVPSLYLAVFSEVFCSILLILGLFTRGALLPLIFTMMVALLIVHGSHPFAKQEMALLYTAGYTAILMLGPGRFSFDHFLFKQKQSS